MQVNKIRPYEKYTQNLLIPVAQDRNKNVPTIAFVIMDKENIESLEILPHEPAEVYC